MRCMLCGREFDESDMIVGKNHTGQEVWYCEECFEEMRGISIETIEQRKNKSKFIFLGVFLLLLTAYYFVANLYISMFLYLAMSVVICFGLDLFNHYYGNDIVQLIAIVVMSFIFNPFSSAFHLFILGALLQTLPISPSDVAPHGATRRKYGSTCASIGLLLCLVGLIRGAYNIIGG